MFRGSKDKILLIAVCGLFFSGQLRGQVGDDAPARSTPSAPTKKNAEDQIWQSSYLTGDWGKARDLLAKKGVEFSAQYTNELFGNPYGGNYGHGVAYNGLLNAGVDVDLGQLTGVIEGTTFHVNGFWRHGESGSQKYVGDYSIFSNIDAYDTVRLDELWLKQMLWGDRLTLKAGQLAVDSDFFGTHYGALFISSTFGAFPFIGANFQPYSPPIYPLASTGVYLKVKPVEEFYLQAAAYYGDTGSQQDNNHGTRFNYSGSSGVFAFSEAGYLLNQEKDSKGLSGTYKLGNWVHTANFKTWASQAAFANASGSLEGVGVNYGIYGVIDQVLWNGPSSKDGNPQSLGLFLRSGWAPSNVSQVAFDIDGGINFTGLVPGRPMDVWGLGLARTALSHDFSEASVSVGGPAFGYEAIIEETYSLQLAPWWQLQPDLQYIFSAGATQTAPNAFVVGLRSVISF